jgi:uncharacterized damage-inducible protein DinB
MKDSLLQLLRYHEWANRRMISLLQSLDDTTLDLELVSSFPGIRATVYHCWGAEAMWLQRLKLVEHPVWKQEGFNGSFQEACTQWAEATAALVQYAATRYDDRAFSATIQYQTSKKEVFKNTVSGILMHLVNHATYHRGQLVTMLRQAGITRIPATDMIVYLRSQ